MPAERPVAASASRVGGPQAKRDHYPTPQDRRQLARTIRAQQRAHGIEPVPEPQQEETAGWHEWMAGWASSIGGASSEVASYIWDRLPTTETPSEAPAAKAPKKQTFQAGQGGVMVAEFDFRNAKEGPRTHHDVVPELERFLGKGKVHVLPMNQGGVPFTRNEAFETPLKMITSRGSELNPQYRQIHASALEFFNQSGIAHEQIPHNLNMANFEYVPSSRLLILADIGNSKVSEPIIVKELKRVFGDPKHIIKLELNIDLKDELGGYLCYDLDLAFHATRNRDGKDVALIYEPCIVENPTAPRMGRQQVLDTLRKLKFDVIEISAEDQHNLATNCLSALDGSGRLLFPNKDISDKLRSDLEAHGLTPVFPQSKEGLGNRYAKGGAYGIHCLTVNLRRPQSEIEQADEKKKKEL
ncbi:hypothetical protein J7E62_05670 [Variovorax paradoxus]|nr:hypothetical protein [Variovorax paradoxus]